MKRRSNSSNWKECLRWGRDGGGDTCDGDGDVGDDDDDVGGDVGGGDDDNYNDVDDHEDNYDF